MQRRVRVCCTGVHETWWCVTGRGSRYSQECEGRLQRSRGGVWHVPMMLKDHGADPLRYVRARTAVNHQRHDGCIRGHSCHANVEDTRKKAALFVKSRTVIDRNHGRPERMRICCRSMNNTDLGVHPVCRASVIQYAPFVPTVLTPTPVRLERSEHPCA